MGAYFELVMLLALYAPLLLVAVVQKGLQFSKVVLQTDFAGIKISSVDFFFFSPLRVIKRNVQVSKKVKERYNHLAHQIRGDFMISHSWIFIYSFAFENKQRTS